MTAEQRRLFESAALRITLAVLGLCACAGTEGERGARAEERAAREAAAPAEPVPWPGGFEMQAVLMAVRVTIEGPEGLREHAAVLQDPEHHAYEERTTTEGFLRRTALKPGVDYLAPIRGRLDGLEIFAEEELVVLERPGPAELSVRATGEVFWRDVASGEERRSEQLVLAGGR